ncbi:MAG: hypothetical protein LBH62_07330 [Nitrososphaerota archaeon]|nr:hypothetical protein [Nitrososphaerota archaeon]
MTNCPRCNSSADPTGKEWKYGLFHVKQYLCTKCKKRHMEYYKDNKLSHTIPKSK